MLVIHNNLLTDAQQWSLNPPLMLRHFSTSGDLWCVHTSIVVHRPTSFDIARCRPSSLSDATATRLGIAGHRSKSIVDQCTAMKSERIIMVRSGQTSIVLHWPTSVDSSLLWDYPRFVHIVAVASLSDEGDIERCQKASADVQRWKYERTISRHLYWNDVTLMVHSDFIAAHRSANICVCNAGGHVQKAVSANVGWCKAIEDWMHSTIFRFQGPPFWHENYRSTP